MNIVKNRLMRTGNNQKWIARSVSF